MIYHKAPCWYECMYFRPVSVFNVWKLLNNNLFYSSGECWVHAFGFCSSPSVSFYLIDKYVPKLLEMNNTRGQSCSDLCFISLIILDKLIFTKSFDNILKPSAKVTLYHLFVWSVIGKSNLMGNCYCHLLKSSLRFSGSDTYYIVSFILVENLFRQQGSCMKQCTNYYTCRSTHTVVFAVKIIISIHYYLFSLHTGLFHCVVTVL